MGSALLCCSGVEIHVLGDRERRLEGLKFNSLVLYDVDRLGNPLHSLCAVHLQAYKVNAKSNVFFYT
ncbi:hypothetical protein STEG23_038199 [Scotinomys teguina]